MNPRGIRAAVAAGLLAALTVGAAAPAALACSCAVPGAATINRADVVFTGTVTARSDPNAGEPIHSSADPITYAIAVDDELKGDVDGMAQVVTARDSATCGVDFEVGKRYFVVADRPDAGGALTTGLCQGTQALPPGDPLPAFAKGLEGTGPAAGRLAWRVPERIHPPTLGTGAPDVAVSPSGATTVVWPELTFRPTVPRGGGGFRARVLAASGAAPGAVGAPGVLSAVGEHATGPSVGAAGEMHVAVWRGVREGVASAIVARIRDEAGAWGPPADLEAVTGLGAPAVAGNGAGEALAAWRSGAAVRAARFTDGAWQPAATIASEPGGAPAVALGADGTAVAGWWTQGGKRLVARAALRSPGGVWSPPVTLSRSQDVDQLGAVTEPLSVGAGGGEGVVAWRQPTRPGRSVTYAARLTSTGALAGRRRLSSRVAPVSVGVDASGRATAVWSEFTGDRSVLRWATQVAGKRWGAPRRVAVQPCGLARRPSVRVAPGGGAVALWTQFHPDGLVVLAADRAPGRGFGTPREISREGASSPALAVAHEVAVAAWSRTYAGNDARPGIEVATGLAVADGAQAPPALPAITTPRVTALRAPASIAVRDRLRLGVTLSSDARIDVRIIRTSGGLRYVVHSRRTGRAGANVVSIPTRIPGRRLGPGIHRIEVRAMDAGRESCPVARELVVRAEESPTRR